MFPYTLWKWPAEPSHSSGLSRSEKVGRPRQEKPEKNVIEQKTSATEFFTAPSGLPRRFGGENTYSRMRRLPLLILALTVMLGHLETGLPSTLSSGMSRAMVKGKTLGPSRLFVLGSDARPALKDYPTVKPTAMLLTPFSTSPSAVTSWLIPFLVLFPVRLTPSAQA